MRRSLSALLLAGALAVGMAVPAVAGPPTGVTIYDVASSNDDFDILTAAVEAFGLDAALDGKRQFTVFAPTDSAFMALAGVTDEDAAIPALLDRFGADTVFDVLTYHVVPGQRLSGVVVSSSQLNTLLRGAFIPVEVTGSGVDVANASLVLDLIDIETDNGVVHVVDAVMLP